MIQDTRDANVPDQAPATLQLSFADRSYLFQLYRNNKAPKALPSQLVSLLTSGTFLFVGVNIQGDLTRLKNSYELDTSLMPFEDIVRLLKDRGYNLRKLGGEGLANILRLVVKQNLKKPTQMRRYTKWGKPTLSSDEILYAVTDSYASLIAHKAVSAIADPRYQPPLEFEALVDGHKLLLFNANKTVCVASGFYVKHNRDTFGRHKLDVKSKTGRRIVICLENVYHSSMLAPYAQVPLGHLVRGEDKKVLWDLKFVATHDEKTEEWRVQRDAEYQAPETVEIMDMADFASLDEGESLDPLPPGPVVVNQVPGENDVDDADISELPDLVDDEVENDILSELLGEGVGGFGRDLRTLFDNIVVCQVPEGIPIRKDVFHALQQILRYVPQKHGAFATFAAALRDVLLRFYKPDVLAVDTHLASEGLTSDQIAEKKRTDISFWLKECRRIAPPARILLPDFVNTIVAFGNLIDAKTRKPLLSDKALKEIVNVAKHIAKGCLSDPEGVALYREIGKRQNGLPKRYCSRGTNINESCHKQYRRTFHQNAVSPKRADYILAYFSQWWSVNMAVKHGGLSPEY
ncbi:hypothetical protein HDV05_000698, partial [Chytridiales sp. JEL 0842]